MSGSKKTECLKKQYGANSTEYICATENANRCAIRVYGGGTAPSYCINNTVGWNEKAASDCKACAEQVPDIISWSYGGFRNYACNGAPKKCDVKGSGGSGGNTFGCCRVYQVEKEEKFFYSKTVSQEYADCLRACGKDAKCPAQVKPGVYMNASHVSLNCWASCDCPYPSTSSGSSTFVGVRVSLKCKYEGKMCTNDEVVWM